MTLKNLLGISLDAVAPDRGLPQPKVIMLDALRKQRNLSDYSGDLIPDSAADECLASAQDLLAHVHSWLRSNRPDLL